MMMLPGKKEGERKGGSWGKKGNKLLLWKVRTRAPQLGRRSHATETAHFQAPLCSRLSPDSWIPRNPPVPNHCADHCLLEQGPVQTRQRCPQPLETYFENGDHNVASTVTKMATIFMYKLPKHYLQSHLIICCDYIRRMRSSQSPFLLMRKV